MGSGAHRPQHLLGGREEWSRPAEDRIRSTEQELGEIYEAIEKERIDRVLQVWSDDL